jgi:NagD protein
MLRSALNAMEAHSEATVMIGDRMETDIVTGLEGGMRTVLVLSGSTAEDEVDRFPYRPWMVAGALGELDIDTLLST